MRIIVTVHCQVSRTRMQQRSHVSGYPRQASRRAPRRMVRATKLSLRHALSRCMSLGEVLRGEGGISPAAPRNRNNDQPSTGQLLSEVWSLSATRSCLEDITAGHTYHHDVSFCPIATNYAKKKYIDSFLKLTQALMHWCIPAQACTGQR